MVKSQERNKGQKVEGKGRSERRSRARGMTYQGLGDRRTSRSVATHFLLSRLDLARRSSQDMVSGRRRESS